ncbi:MAG: hypothetical protein H7233_12365 [Pseudorhodobacter sp.]|nr:hypothetical protein [Frankiaceae bacterium]
MDATDTREQQRPSTGTDHGRNRAYIAGCLIAAVAAAAVGVALLTGGDDKSVAAPTTPPPVASSPAPTPTVSTPPRPEDLAVAAAKTRYQDYLRVTRGVAEGGYTDLAAYDTVAIDPHTGVLLQSAAQTAGLRSTGDAEVVSLTVQSVELDPPGQYPSVRLLACLDVSQTDVLDAAGRSVITPDRVERFRSEVVVQNIPSGAFTDGRKPGWYVAEVEQRGEPC